ncbi:MAG: class I SAM-dependent rRNA methyltransferase [Elusimicrobiota bacterium]
MPDKPIALELKRGEEDRLVRGHPWVFSNELKTVPRDAEPGVLATVQTAKGRVMGVGFFNPKSLISFRLLSREPVAIDFAFFRRRFEDAISLRERRLPGESSYRLCFGESDGLPGLVVDKYGSILVLQVLAAGIERRLDLICKALTEVVRPDGIYLHNDHPVRTLEGLTREDKVFSGEVPETVSIVSAGLKYEIPVRKGQKTGFYFDQRENRAALAPYCRGRTVLDLHCYIGAFAMTAAKSGAEKVLGLDSSAPAIEIARSNAELNGLSENCEFDEGDAEDVLEAFAEKRRSIRPNLIVLDPPSLVPAKKHLAKALRAYERLNAAALRILPKGGILATSTCSHHVGREDFLRMLRLAAGRVGRSVRLLELRGQACDHPVLLSMTETEYLHFALLETV